MEFHRNRAKEEAISIELTRRCQAARSFLFGEMLRLGLLPEDGWRIADKTRLIKGRTEIVFWPVHSHLPSPAGLECVVSIDESSMEVDNTCEPEAPAANPVA